MDESYRSQLIEAMRELLPGQFFRVWPRGATPSGRRSGWPGPACSWPGGSKIRWSNVLRRCASVCTRLAHIGRWEHRMTVG